MTDHPIYQILQQSAKENVELIYFVMKNQKNIVILRMNLNFTYFYIMLYFINFINSILFILLFYLFSFQLSLLMFLLTQISFFLYFPFRYIHSSFRNYFLCFEDFMSFTIFRLFFHFLYIYKFKLHFNLFWYLIYNLILYHH